MKNCRGVEPRRGASRRNLGTRVRILYHKSTSIFQQKRNDTWVVPYNVSFSMDYIPCRGVIRRERPACRSARFKCNFLPFLSGSGESENVRISLAECGSEQPEFAARNMATTESVQRKNRDINPIGLKFLRSRGFFQEAPCRVWDRVPRSSASPAKLFRAFRFRNNTFTFS